LGKNWILLIIPIYAKVSKNKLTKLLAITIFSISLNAFSLLPLTPVITISTSYVSATAGTAITPVTITNAGLISYYSISPAISNGINRVVQKCAGLCGRFSKG
jgi:hypothetical protein